MKLAPAEHCVFCQIEPSQILLANDTMLAIADKYPVTAGHLLIIPKQHRKDFFELTGKERSDSAQLLQQLKQRLQAEDESITGFNIGVNCGQDAGQTVFHCHIHFIPRRKGDMDNPTGGVRGVIPSKRIYGSEF